MTLAQGAYAQRGTEAGSSSSCVSTCLSAQGPVLSPDPAEPTLPLHLQCCGVSSGSLRIMLFYISKDTPEKLENDVQKY